MKKIGKGIGILLIVAIVSIVLFLISAPIVNDISADGIKNRLLELPLPQNTECLEGVSKAGKLEGCGNGMQFFGAILIKSDLSMDELEKHYIAYRQNDYDCLIEVQKGQEIEVIEYNRLSFETDILEGEQYYIIYTWGDGIEPFRTFDIRGN